MALSGADVANAAVRMVVGVPTHEAGATGARMLEIGEALVGNSGRSLAVRNNELA